MPLIQSKQIAAARAGIATRGTAQATRVRAGMIALGCVLGLWALWQLAAALAHPAAPYFLPVVATEQADQAPAAARAAEIAQVRGDYWFDDALLSFPELGDSAAPNTADLERARTSAVRAARLAPHDARTWLLLALIDAKLGSDAAQQTEALKMSYYTGPDDVALIPSRLKLAVQSAAIVDPDFRELVSGEVLAAVRQPTLHAALVAAYRQASPEGKRFLQSAVGALDSGLAGQMRASESDPIRY